MDTWFVCIGLGSGRALWGWVGPIGAHSSLQLCMDYQECCLTANLANKVFANPGIDSGKQQTPSPDLCSGGTSCRLT